MFEIKNFYGTFAYTVPRGFFAARITARFMHSSGLTVLREGTVAKLDRTRAHCVINIRIPSSRRGEYFLFVLFSDIKAVIAGMKLAWMKGFD